MASDTPHRATSDPLDQLLQRAARLTPVPAALHPRLHPGRELCGGRFELRERIGAGGMGVVHEAFDRERGAIVALKTLVRLDARSIYRLKNEFRLLAQVTHPNLVHLHELFVDGDLWLFSMERIHGEPFDLHVRPGGRLDEGRLRRALPQLALGVSAIHAAGKLHRDLKPSNVLVTAEGRVVVLDFGLVADPEPGGVGQTLEEERRSGTPAYMAPEQVAGKTAGEAADAYAIGAMLFEALTGALPFDGEVHEILYRKQTQPAPLPTDLAPHAPQDLARLCSALLVRPPDKRPTCAVIARRAAEPGAREHAVAGAAPRVDPAGSGLIGRAAERLELEAALAHAEAGRTAVVCVRGEPGAGTSALVSAFLDGLRARGGSVVLRGRCHERESLPYKALDGVVDELSRHLLQQPDAELRELLPAGAGAVARLFPVLERIEAVSALSERAGKDDPSARRLAFAAFADLLRRVRARQPLVIHIDDLQWMDPDSALLLEDLVSAPEPPSVLLVLSYRIEAVPSPLLARLHAALAHARTLEQRTLELGPLSLADATLLAAREIGPRPDAATWSRAVAENAQGSPLFVCELARHVTALGQLPDEPSVTLERAVEARVAGLGALARELFELLVVAGRPMSSELLARASGTPADAPVAIDELGAAHLVRFCGAGRFDCYHERIRRVALAGIDAGRAQALLARLIAACGSRRRELPEVLFDLCLAAGQRAQAAEHAIAAATRASSALAFERSAELLAAAIELLPEAEVARQRLHERRAEALSSAGRFKEAGAAFDAAARHDPSRRHPLLRRSALSFLSSGSEREGTARLRTVLEHAGIRWPRTLLGAYLGAGVRLLRLWFWSARVAARGTEAEHAPKARDEREQLRLELLLESACLLPTYDVARGLALLTLFVRTAVRSREAAYHAVALGALSTVFASLRLGAARAQRLADEAVRIARTHDTAHLRSGALTFASTTRLFAGRLHDALALGTEAEAQLGDGARAHFYESWTARVVQAYALIELGRVRESAALFQANTRIARELGDDFALVGSSSVIGNLAVDDVQGAETLLAQERAVLAKAGSRGVLPESVALDAALLALYRSEGATLLGSPVLSGPGLRFVSAAVTEACAALQGPPDARCRRSVRRTIALLRRGRGPSGQRGTVAQLEAALCVMDGDLDRARELLRVAAAHYEHDEMLMHAALMRLREAGLRGDQAGARTVEEQLALLKRQGIARPYAWANVFAPGLGPVPATTASARSARS